MKDISFDDPNHSQEEERFMMLGLSDHAKMLIVCHCYRGMDDVIRIISPLHNGRGVEHL